MKPLQLPYGKLDFKIFNCDALIARAEQMEKESPSVCMEFEEDFDESLFVPDIVRNNQGFFNSLSTVGLNVVGRTGTRVVEPHQRRFNLLDGVEFMTGPLGHVLAFEVPPLGQEQLRREIADNTTMLTSSGVGSASPDVCYGVRPYIKGPEAVCFKVQYVKGNEYYLWVGSRIEKIETTECFTGTADGDTLVITSEVGKGFSFASDMYKDMVVGRWTTLTTTVLAEPSGGLEFNINFRNFFVPKIPSFVLKVENGIARDSTRIYGNPCALSNGCWEMVFRSDVSKHSESFVRQCPSIDDDRVIVLQKREDRLYADSYQHISVMRDKCLLYDEIEERFPIKHFNDVVQDQFYFRYHDDSKDLKIMESLGDPKVDILASASNVNREFKKPSQARTYFHNVAQANVVSCFIQPRIKKKKYQSWGDAFLGFRTSQIRKVVPSNKGKLVVCGPFRLRCFQKFLTDSKMYEKDRVIHDLFILRKMLGTKNWRLPANNKIRVCRRPPRGVDYYEYRGHYVFYDRIDDTEEGEKSLKENLSSQ